jgi:hypothetical protein
MSLNIEVNARLKPSSADFSVPTLRIRIKIVENSPPPSPPLTEGRRVSLEATV